MSFPITNNHAQLTKLSDGSTSTVAEFYVKYVAPHLPAPAVVRHWHQLLTNYVQRPDALLMVRRYHNWAKGKKDESLRRGFLSVDPTGFGYVFGDNVLPQFVAAWVMAGELPTLEQWSTAMASYKMPLVGTRFVTQAERKHNIFALAPTVLGNKGWKLAHLHSVNGIYAGVNFRSYIQELLPRGDYEEWAGDDHIRRLKQAITPADRALLVAHFLRAVHPLNYFLSPGTSHQATRPDIGESALVQQYVRYQFGHIYGEQLLTEFEHLLMLEPQLEIAAGQVAGDTLLPLTVEWNARKKLSPAGAATTKAKDIKVPKTAKRIEMKARVISNLPPAYSRLFERYRDQKIGVFARAVFEQLFADGRISTYLPRLQDDAYSRQQLGLYVPVLARRREKISGGYRHYSGLLIYEGHEYYLGSQWNNGRREKLESWLTDTVFSQDNPA